MSAHLPRVVDGVRAVRLIGEAGGVGDLKLLLAIEPAERLGFSRTPRCVPLVPMYSVSSTRPCGSVFWMLKFQVCAYAIRKFGIDGVGVGEDVGMDEAGEPVL